MESVEATVTKAEPVTTGRIEINKRVRTADILRVVADETVALKRRAGTEAVVVAHREGEHDHLVRYDDGTLAVFTGSELDVVDVPTVEVRRFALFSTDVPWPATPAEKMVDFYVPAPANFERVIALGVRVKDGPPRVGLRIVFSGSPDAPDVPCRVILASEAEAINIRVDAEARLHPTLVDVVVSPLNGEVLGVWLIPVAEKVTEVPTIHIPATPVR